MNKIIVFSMIAFFFTACNNPFAKTTNMYFYNDSHFKIGFTLPNDIPWEQKWITQTTIDTTMSSFFKWSDNYSSLLPYDNGFYRMRFASFEEWFPKESSILPFFIFDFSTMENAGANTIAFYNKDEYIVRYDLTISDIYFLLNSDGALELHFPPDERMKDIHMWPPYEEVIDKYCY